MSKTKYEVAKELVQLGRLEQARTLLTTIDEPRARSWIAAIDEELYDQAQETVNTSPFRRNRALVYTLGTLVFLTLTFSLIVIGSEVVSILREEPEMLPTLADVSVIAFQPTIATEAATEMTATNTRMPSVTPTLQFTNTPIATATPTNTRIPTETLTPTTTNTPTLDELADITVANRPDSAWRRYEIVAVNSEVIHIDWLLTDLPLSAAREDARVSPVEITCALREAGFRTQTYQLRGLLTVIDTNTGERITGEGVQAVLPPQVHSRVRCNTSNLDAIDLAVLVAQNEPSGALYSLDPLLIE